MAKHYAVTITASRTAVEPEVLARRLAELLNRSVEEVAEALDSDTVILQRELRYSEAIEIQRELNRRKVPAQVSAEKELSGRELLFGWEVSTSQSPAQQVVEQSNDGQESAPDEGRSERGMDEENPWADLFPDLEEEQVESDPESEVSSQNRSADSAVVLMQASEPGELEEDWNEEDWDDVEWDDVEWDEEAIAPAGMAVDAEEQGGAYLGSGSPKNEAVSAAVEVEEPVVERRFDPGKIRQAFVGGEKERPPYKPKGFDTRIKHLPILAAVLSFIAPGTGQIYNGQPERAQRYGLTFFLLYPWYDSVRQAFAYGQKVRTYYAPRPDEGVVKRTIEYGVKWWVAMASVAIITGFTVSMIQDYQEKQQAHRDQLVFQQLVYFSQDSVQKSVSRGLRASEMAEVESQDDSEKSIAYTMSEEERGRRLFILGYHHCASHQFSMCEELMRRVAIVAPRNRDALRLQAWASMQARSLDPNLEMPEVDGDVPTLSEFEIELATEGTDVEELDVAFDEWWDDEGR